MVDEVHALRVCLLSNNSNALEQLDCSIPTNKLVLTLWTGKQCRRDAHWKCDCMCVCVCCTFRTHCDVWCSRARARVVESESTDRPTGGLIYNVYSNEWWAARNNSLHVLYKSIPHAGSRGKKPSNMTARSPSSCRMIQLQFAARAELCQPDKVALVALLFGLSSIAIIFQNTE